MSATELASITWIICLMWDSNRGLYDFGGGVSLVIVFFASKTLSDRVGEGKPLSR